MNKRSLKGLLFLAGGGIGLGIVAQVCSLADIDVYPVLAVLFPLAIFSKVYSAELNLSAMPIGKSRRDWFANPPPEKLFMDRATIAGLLYMAFSLIMMSLFLWHFGQVRGGLFFLPRSDAIRVATREESHAYHAHVTFGLAGCAQAFLLPAAAGAVYHLRRLRA